MNLVAKAFEWGPLWFGVAFIAPLVAQSLDAGGMSAPLGLSGIQFGLAIGVVMGTVAKLRGSWI